MRALSLFLLLAGCGAIEAHQARNRLLGMAEADLIACAGPASKNAEIGPGEHVLAVEYDGDKTALASIKVLEDVSLSIGATGSCHALFRIRAGKVVAVHYEGNSTSFSGTESACAPIVRDCLR
jgi:hypothetical protein